MSELSLNERSQGGPLGLTTLIECVVDLTRPLGLGTHLALA